MDNPAIARSFYRLAALMEIRGDDPFRLRSYRNAGEAIETWPTPLKTIAANEGVPGLQSFPESVKQLPERLSNCLTGAPSTRGNESRKRRQRPFLTCLRSPESDQRLPPYFIRSSKSRRSMN